MALAALAFASAALFGLFRIVVPRPLAYPRPEQLMLITTRVQGVERFWVSGPEYFELKELTHSFSTIGAFRTGEGTLAAADRRRRVKTADVNVELLETLGMPAERGRLFERREVAQSARGFVLLSHEFWQTVFGSREDVVGSTIEVNGELRLVVGIMPPGFDVVDSGVDVWLPLVIDSANREEWNRNAHTYYLIGRLKDGVNEADATFELDTLLPTWDERVGAKQHTFKPGVHTLQMEPLRHGIVLSAERAIAVLRLGGARSS